MDEMLWLNITQYMYSLEDYEEENKKNKNKKHRLILYDIQNWHY